jgi:hypothetical protein
MATRGDKTEERDKTSFDGWEELVNDAFDRMGMNPPTMQNDEFTMTFSWGAGSNEFLVDIKDVPAKAGKMEVWRLILNGRIVAHSPRTREIVVEMVLHEAASTMQEWAQEA